jgi:hypothetical protein
MLTIPRTQNTKNKNTETKKRTPVRKRTQTLKRGGVDDGDALDTCQLPSITLTQQFNVFAMNIIENDICDKSFNKSLLELKSMVDAKGRRDSLAVRTGQQVIDCYKASDFYDENDTIYVFEVLKSGDSSITDANRNDFSMMNMFCKIDEVSKRLVDIIMSKQRFEERIASFQGGGKNKDKEFLMQLGLATGIWLSLCVACPPVAAAIAAIVAGGITYQFLVNSEIKISEMIANLLFRDQKNREIFVNYIDNGKVYKASALVWKNLFYSCWNPAKLEDIIAKKYAPLLAPVASPQLASQQESPSLQLASQPESSPLQQAGKPKRTRKVETLKTEKSTKLIDKDTSKKLSDKPKRTNKKPTTAVTKK